MPESEAIPDPNNPTPAPSSTIPVLIPPSTSLTAEQHAFYQDILDHLGLTVPSAASSGIPSVLGKRKIGPPQTRKPISLFDGIHQSHCAGYIEGLTINAFWNMKRILTYGCLKSFPTAGAARIDDLPPSERAGHHADIFAKIMSTCRIDLLPVLQHIYHDSNARPAVWQALCDRLAILLPIPGSDCLFPPIEQGIAKSKRGLAHPQLRMLIMPWKDRVLFPPLIYGPPANPTPTLSPEAQTIYDKIVASQYTPSCKYFPSFCYPDGQWNPDAYLENLFTGVAIWRGIRLLFVSRSGAINAADDELSYGCLAAIHNIRRVTAHMVAYVVVQVMCIYSQVYAETVQVWLSISSAPQWTNQESKKYKFTVLYQKVLDAFADDSDPDRPEWGKETLDWLTERVFGEGDDNLSDGSDCDGAASEDEAVAQRRRRASQRVLADATNSGGT
ncbi:hypothetical protein MIND_01190000 [Mycena indigotica]|uniref:Uncharacterized protein n=1 Tax=Mycena indigotica TaxID=2126181 RepID=A0A8H6S4T5_9AGAR|nr:uncharacterized protein MIND_01190000 [Mycena indigotica]KAF7292909.1 hypothetical protein MIND_01190000 [Mycena indigotica]